jgi:ABC-type multidrug transport system fused ATPase/permease subunit
VNTPSLPTNATSFPDAWRTIAQSQLLDNEEILAQLAINLDDSLNFSPSLLIVTNQRLLCLDGQHIRDYPYHEGLTLQSHDHGGVGRIELFDGGNRMACWFYTLAVQPTRFIKQFQQQLTRFITGNAVPQEVPEFCPDCLTPLTTDQTECPHCSSTLNAPPRAWTLLRLWRFAKPYQWQLLAGFLLMLASTAATLVPPYLTMPLMDKVLIPYQNGTPIDFVIVTWLLAGLLGSALLAWGLGWAKTYILALVSERIGADLRTITYEHLLRLSLEYFGGKRTGDLMSRIGSESDRICVFLSLHLLDFATDVLMIVMTSVILFSINPWLALVTLLPLPFIAWMIHHVRDRLRTGFEKIDRVWSQVSNVLADTIPGIRVVKAFAQERRNRAVIKDLSLAIEPGEMIGLVGHSGSGKSTLVNLMCRFYDVTEGSISIDGVNIRSLPVSEYRRHIGLVLQDPFLFFGSIAENIAYGKPDATRAEIIAAARAAHAHEFILRLPHGYDSLVGERGHGLSGGERQRISIARALLIDPRILILDEATASVDTETEKEIQKALDNLVHGRTTIAIAHRLSTLHKANRLVVLDKGEIVEIGNHDELMAKQGAYYRLYQAQARNVDTDMSDAEEKVQIDSKVSA